MDSRTNYDLEKTLVEIRLHLADNTVLLNKISKQFDVYIKEGNGDRIKVRTLIIIMILSYLLFLGEKVKELLNVEFLKILF